MAISTASFFIPKDLTTLTGRFHFLTIPGFRNSGPEHWQTIWESLYPEQFTRVEQDDWDYPARENWIDKIESYVQEATLPLIVIAHSLGCIAFAQWAQQNDVSNIAGALLVAPADVDQSPNPLINSFSPAPDKKLPFLSVVIASTNDPFAAIYRQAYLAAHWGSKFVSIGDKGHINAASNLGNWNEGLDILQNDLLKKIIDQQASAI